MKVIITIPAYNEERTIGKVIDEINSVMKTTSYNYQIQVVDDGSKDSTSSVARKSGAKVIKHKRNLGLKQTFLTEMRECIKNNADIIVHTDADGQYPAEYIPKLIEQLEKGHDLVLGSRFKNSNSALPFLKLIGNKAFALVFSHILKQKLTDTTTGFRAFTREAAENIEITTNFTYTQEQLIRAAKQKYSIKEVSIKSRKTRASRLFSSPLQYAVKAWINIFRIYRDYDPIKFFGSAGLLLFIPGFLLGIYMTYLHFSGGIKGHIGLLFLMFLLMIVGIQIMAFGFLADMFRS